MLDVARWLAEQGLEQYAEAFAENAIDGEVLRTLSADDLKELGVKALGHRKKLLAAIALLTEEPATTRAAEDSPRRTVEPSGVPERRQLTVMFVDLVGSTELSARLDPEDMGTVIRAYQDCCAEVVERWDGHVAKYMGDGVLVYFGHPQAHEDEAERAISAGLAIIDALAGLETPAGKALAARVGIATGMVMVGELIGVGAAREETVVGETPNLAARLQGLAGPGAVVISRRTRRLVRGLFELTDLGPQRLKGFAELVGAWRVEGKGRAEGRFEARHGARLTPLVGREEEIALLLRRWRQAKEEEGQVVLVSGEPGIGKSRLVHELRARLEGEPHVRLLYQCSPHHTTSPLHPQIEQLERAAGFERDDPPEAKLEKLEALLARGTIRLDEAMPLVAALLGVPTGDCYAPLDLTPQRQKQRTLEVLVDQLAGLGAVQPVLVAYEDVHWIDPTTQELLGLVIERIQHLPVLAIITFRPDFPLPWSGQPHVSALALTRLGRREGAAMVDRVVGAKALPAEVSAQIVAKTDGVPLFVEELTKAVLESGVLNDTGEGYELSSPLPPLAIPSTLHDSLLARLDRLAPVKEVAQIGAAIGRKFSHALLAAVADRPDDQLRGALDQLVSSELVFRRGDPPDATYSFKHALVQDAAYGTLVKSRRQYLHARIAKVLEEQFPEAAEAQPELLAQHYTAAELAAEAVPYWLRAGRHALQRCAMREAMAQLTQGLNLLTELPANPERDRKELDLRLAFGNALGGAQGTAALETKQEYARVVELCERTGDAANLGAALFGLTSFHLSRGELTSALEVAERALAAADRGNDVYIQAAGHFAVGWVDLALGRLHSARTHLEHAVGMLDPARRDSFVGYRLDLRVVSLVYLSWTLVALGYPDRARDFSRQALAEAEDLAHPATLAVALDRTTAVAELCRDITTVAQRAKTISALGREQGFPYYVAKGDFNRGWVTVNDGRIAEGIALMRAALCVFRATGDEEFMPHSLGLLAAAQARLQEVPPAFSLVRDALARVTRTGERLFEADLHCLAGDLLLALMQPDQAEECFHQAIAVAREQDARWWELRAATRLARLWRDQGKRAEARELLATVYGWFTEGFDTADLKEARALLDDLA